MVDYEGVEIGCGCGSRCVVCGGDGCFFGRIGVDGFGGFFVDFFIDDEFGFWVFGEVVGGGVFECL